ncbi:MAG: hypothetical protein IKG18_10985, partial [Atopobiaceae bacterium]|nr:hypothetical protein [Atopobiaceae bacterium]
MHWRDGRAVESSVRLSRVRCTRCGATHALIPTSLVAYSPYSVLLCVHVVLLVRASRGLSREAAARFHASLTTCRRLASDAARLAEALDCAISSLGAELAAACRDACALAERFAARHGTTPFSAVP